MQLSRGQLSWGQLSGWQLSKGKLSGVNYPGGNCPRDNHPGVNCPGSNHPGAIILWGKCSGGNYPGGNCPGGNYPVPKKTEDGKNLFFKALVCGLRKLYVVNFLSNALHEKVMICYLRYIRCTVC